MRNLQRLVLTLDGRDILSDKNAVLDILMIERSSDPVPTIEIEFLVDQSLEELGILRADNPFSIDITLDGGQTIQRSYRLLGYDNVKTDSGYGYIFRGYMDNPAVIYRAHHESLTGTSSDVIRRIAGRYFDVSVTNTNDLQTWINTGKDDIDWMNEISLYSFLDDSSAFAYHISGDRRFRFVNLRDTLAQEGRVLSNTFQSQDSDIIPVEVITPRANIQSNYTIGYGEGHYVYDGSYKGFSRGRIQRSPRARGVDLNTDYGNLLTFRQNFFSSQNSHRNSDFAKYLNRRLKNIYTNSQVSCIVPYPVLDIFPLNTVSLQLSDRDDTSLQGNYIVCEVLITNRVGKEDSLEQQLTICRPGKEDDV